MCKKDVSIVNELGLHARTAAVMAQIAAKAKNGVWIMDGDRKVDASSVIDILGLARGKGATITLKIDDRSDQPVLDELINAVETGFGE
ncbi:MAG: HPr family phosphocarrier protein [Thermodesulfobacteriota bacterium]|nr:HPr family phosphocarrier protein [Thermodesulfobacteriota bacterium]